MIEVIYNYIRMQVLNQTVMAVWYNSLLFSFFNFYTYYLFTVSLWPNLIKLQY